jgi:metal-sulfur cluster biosynthetic enzyme
VYSALDEVKDPCMQAAGLDLSIVDLGLVYDVTVEERCVTVAITFTEIGCIFTHTIGVKVHDTVMALPGVEQVEISPRWLPIWTHDRLNEKASRALARQRVQMFDNVKRRGLQQATHQIH